MYEAQTYEAILSRMLQKALSINDNLDTREGSLVWCGDAPAAVELQNLYIALDTVLNETFADTATRPYLILRAAERGLKPQPASPAVLQLSIIMVWKTENLEPLAYLIPAIFAELATATGFYYSKAKAENRIKLRKLYGPEIYNDAKEI